MRKPGACVLKFDNHECGIVGYPSGEYHDTFDIHLLRYPGNIHRDTDEWWSYTDFSVEAKWKQCWIQQCQLRKLITSRWRHCKSSNDFIAGMCKSPDCRFECRYDACNGFSYSIGNY